MINFRRLLTLVKPYAGRLIFAVFSLAIVTLCIVGFTSLVGPIFDQAWTNSNFNAEETGGLLPEIDNDKGSALTVAVEFVHLDKILPPDLRQPIVLIPILLILIFIIKGVFSYTGNYLMASVGQGVVRDIRNSLYGSIIDKPISFFRSRSTGSLISRITNDVEKIQYAVSTNLADLIREALTVIGLGAFVFYLNPTFAFIALVVAPLVLLPIIQLGKRLRKTSRVSQERMEGLTTRLHETFSGIRIVKAFCAEDKEKNRFKKENDKLLDVILRGVKYYSLTAPAMEIIGACAVAYMIYWGSSQIAAGETTVGAFGAILAALYGMYNPIKKLSRINNDLQQAFAAVDRVYDVLATADEIEETPNAIAMPKLEKDIVFENVSFSYGEREILFNIDVTVQKGQVCAIVGLSGAGKTTMVNLLPRFDEVTKGAIRIDGHDIRDFTLSSLRGNIGIVTQDTILFNDTVHSNIAYGMFGSVSQEEIEEAAKAAYAHDFIMNMPEGYDTIIGEKGVRLSGGERQRLAIARALIKNPPILILDEATSSLDSASERLVQGALENLMAERTTFIIAHRLSTVRKADMILVIEKGRIVERGNHEELLEKGGMYKKLHSLQFADVSASQLGQGSPGENK